MIKKYIKRSKLKSIIYKEFKKALKEDDLSKIDILAKRFLKLK
jgi:hypothetical protein